VIPAFVNVRAGTMEQARGALEQGGTFDVRLTEPSQLKQAIEAAIDTLPPTERRVAVAGGDGTVGTAASVILEHGDDVVLAVIPGGTLNHFAKDHGIPTKLDEAVALASSGTVGTADVAYAGERLFLNTSAVGSYVTYVRLRDRLERFMGYRIASIVAAIRLYFHVHPIDVTLDVNGESRTYSTPLVFIGVGERELKAPVLGSRIAGGKHALHVLVVRERRAARLISVALAAMTRGLESVARTPEIDSFLVDQCSITVRTSRRVPHIAVDGEIVEMQEPIEYRLARGALRIVVP